jgi:hypothetical protein
MARKYSGPVQTLPGGRFSLSLEVQDRASLVALIVQLREILLTTSTADMRRLFPAAYHQDPEHDAEYQRLMRDELLASRLQSMNTASEMLQRDPTSKSIELTAAELEEFMRSINNLRLVIGTMLDIQESDDLYEDDGVEEDDPSGVHRQLYHYLGWLLEWVVTAQSAAL